MITSVLTKKRPKLPSVHASTKLSGRNDENSWNGLPVERSGSFRAVERTRTNGRTQIAAQKARNRYFPTLKSVRRGRPGRPLGTVAPCISRSAIRPAPLSQAQEEDGQDEGQDRDHHRDRGAVARVVPAERHLVAVAGEHLGRRAWSALGEHVHDVEDAERTDERDREHEGE